MKFIRGSMVSRQKIYVLSAPRIGPLSLSQHGRYTFLDTLRLKESLRLFGSLRFTSESPNKLSGLEFCIPL